MFLGEEKIGDGDGYSDGADQISPDQPEGM
jgi:hypothetical protein